MPNLAELHDLNIFVHVSCGVIVIALGLLLLFRQKGDRTHRITGRLTVVIACVCIAAALVGAIVFRGNPDLIGVSFLVAYQLWSGPRALRLQRNGADALDAIPAASIFLVGLLIVMLPSASFGFYWEPARVYAVAGALMFFGGWDLLRSAFPSRWRNWLNPGEHAFKMVSMLGAMVTVGLATMVPAYAAEISLLCSSLFTPIGFALAFRASRRFAR